MTSWFWPVRDGNSKRSSSPSCKNSLPPGGFGSALRKQELCVTRKALTSSAVSSSDCHRRSSWCDRVDLRFGSTSTPCQNCSATTLSRSATQIQKANAIIRGFCNHYRTDHSSAVFRWLTNWTLRSFCKWVGRRSGKMTPGKAYRKLTRVNGQKFTMPTAYTPTGKMVTLLSHSRFHRLRFQQVKGMNSPLDPRLAEYWEKRRTQALFRRAIADARKRRMYLLKRQNYRCAITGLPFEETSEIVHPPNCRPTSWWERRLEQSVSRPQMGATQLWARCKGDRTLASLKDVPFSGL